MKKHPDITTEDVELLKTAQYVSYFSECPRLRVGAVITDSEGKLISAGFNSPSGDPDLMNTCTDDGCLLVKGHCMRTIHAEDRALLGLSTSKDSSVGGTLYLTHNPCLSCLKNVIASGIRKIYVLHRSRRKPEVQQYMTELLETNEVELIYTYLENSEIKDLHLSMDINKLSTECKLAIEKLVDFNILPDVYRYLPNIEMFSDRVDKFVEQPLTNQKFYTRYKDIIQREDDPTQEALAQIKRGYNIDYHLRRIFEHKLTDLAVEMAFMGHNLEELMTYPNWVVRANCVKSGYLDVNETEDYRVHVAKKDYLSNETSYYQDRPQAYQNFG